jgi:hypothetical protein
MIYLLAADDRKPIAVEDLPEIVKQILEKAPHFNLTADDKPVRDNLRDALMYVDGQRKKGKKRRSAQSPFKVRRYRGDFLLIVHSLVFLSYG